MTSSALLPVNSQTKPAFSGRSAGLIHAVSLTSPEPRRHLISPARPLNSTFGKMTCSFRLLLPSQPTTSLRQITRAIRLLAEGNSLRSTSRLTGLTVPTLLKLVKVAGKRADFAMDKHLKGVKCRSLQIDEMWTYVNTKQRNLRPGDPHEYGDQYIFVALDGETKLVPCHHVGKRSIWTARVFFSVLRSRLRGRPQITTDGWVIYPDVIEEAFGNGCSYAQVGGGNVQWNNPNPALVSTVFVERFNLTLRMCTRRLTRKCNGFSKKLLMLDRAVSLFFGYYNFCRVHETLGVTPAMEAGLTDRIWTIEKLLVEGRTH